MINFLQKCAVEEILKIEHWENLIDYTFEN